MSRIIMLIPIGNSVGLTSISLGVIRAMERKGVSYNFFKAIDQPNIGEDILDKINVVRKNSNLPIIEPIKISRVEFLLSNNQKDVLLEEIIANYHANTYDTEVVIIQGLISTFRHQFSQLLNFEIAKTLGAEIIFVISQNNETPEKIKERIELASSNLFGTKNNNIIGVIINKFNAPVDNKGHICPFMYEIYNESSKTSSNKFDPTKMQISIPLPLLGIVPWSFDLIATRTIDIVRHLNAIIINKGDINNRRVKSIIFCTHNITHMLKYLRTGSLLVTSTDRYDVIVTSCLAAINGIKISAILLTEGYEINHNINELCKRAFSTGLPVFMVNTTTWQTSIDLQNFDLKIPVDDYERIEKVQEYVSRYIDYNWIRSLTTHSGYNRLLSPPVFRYQLTELARKVDKSIVLPEGDEPRTIKAASICAKRGIANCVLLGNSEKINCIATSHGIELGVGIKIINPELIREHYVSRLVELRKDKGMVEIAAREYLRDNVVLGTLMLEKDEVDGLVSGAMHTTANTIRPSLQLIKIAPGNSIVSSIFFMLLPDDVYIYGDCAINPNPNAEQLAEIAIQSSESAIAFGIEPRIAMLSYSTGNSSKGKDVEKVRKATNIVQKKRPDLIIDGPLQYDAAVIADVAKFKAPHSPVAGRANVFIFPDLNTGNITYKAVQRSANLVSIGPMLQGMRKPVNDLSRGALVDDIVYTIALTAIQSSKQMNFIGGVNT